MNTLLHVSLRQQAVFIPASSLVADAPKQIKGITSVLVANLAKLGFGVSEKLLWALNQSTPTFQADLMEKFREVMGVNKNWTPLVKGWDVPTGENLTDHIMTFFANVFGGRGTQLQCGHIIPPATFPLERYNGCPFCGTPFEAGKIEVMGQNKNLKILNLWTEKEANGFLADLLTSKTALDATQMDSLKILLNILPLPTVEVGMKETMMAVVDILIANKQAEKAQVFFKSPTDVLRYLWYKHTGFLQILEPKTIINRKAKNNKHIGALFVGKKGLDQSAAARLQASKELKLKYDRAMCATVAGWLNGLKMDTETMCEAMHPKRGMWVRFIRALRLAEYSKKAGFEKLKDVLDVFYNEAYDVWAGRVNKFRLRADEEATLKLLKQRPGLFARSLFANMLWFGHESVTQAFGEVVDKVPARLVFTLNMYAQNYFSKNTARMVKPLGGVAKRVAPNQLLKLYNDDQLDVMKESIANLCLLAMKKRFAASPTESKTIFIDEMLYKIPVSIGDRADNVQDLPTALMGTRFPIEGDKVRLFMQWGEGLPAQHMDMDLSCRIAYDNRVDMCSYSQLTPLGCKHSGDIRSIPHKIGTAEYIEIDVPALEKAQARYVAFTCNAFSNGSLSPNMVVGWMNCKEKMHISETTGVAYDPSCVQHQVRVTNSLAKGMVFGVLEIATREVVWLEMPFDGQVVQNLDIRNVKAILAKLDSKLSIGALLQLKAEAQKLEILPTQEGADEAYTLEWSRNTAAVTKLLVD